MYNFGDEMVGKTIKSAKVDGYSIYIEFTDGSVFTYDASDGGYSSYDLENGSEK